MLLRFYAGSGADWIPPDTINETVRHEDGVDDDADTLKPGETTFSFDL